MTGRIQAKRLMGDIKNLQNDPIPNIDVYVEENNMLVWYFMIHGCENHRMKGVNTLEN